MTETGNLTNTPYPVTANQFYEERRRDPLSAEKQLWEAVIEDAINCVRGEGKGFSSANHQRLQMEKDKIWFLSSSDSPGSFRWVCAVLEVDPGAILKKLKNIGGA